MSATATKQDDEQTNVTPGPGAKSKLKSCVDAIIDRMEDRDGINDDIKELMTEIGEMGYNKPAVRQAIKRMRMDPEKRDQLDENLEAIAEALGQPDLFG